MRVALFFIVAVIASTSSFAVHVATAEWLPVWIGSQMQGISVQPSWSVRYFAAASSVEYGIAAITIYYIARNKLLHFGKFKAALVFSALLMATHGALIRQPLMDVVVGNPLHVALVQNGFNWLIWLLMSFCVVYGYEFVNHATRPNKKC